METLFETTKTGTYCVYCHRNKINGKRYIGQTKHGDDPNKRWHLGKHYGRSFKSDIDKYGWDNFDHYIIQNNLSAEEANELEKLNIIAFNTTNPKYGYNERIAGNTNNTERILKDSTKQLISLNTSKAQIGLVWLHRDTTEIQVKPYQVQYYIEQGYTKGRFFDKVWIHNNTKTKMVHKHELQTYLDNGWTKGRFNSSKEAKSMFNKGGDDYE
jgi:GIY-YIG catalytic domain.